MSAAWSLSVFQCLLTLLLVTLRWDFVTAQNEEGNRKYSIYSYHAFSLHIASCHALMMVVMSEICGVPVSSCVEYHAGDLVSVAPPAWD